MLGAYKLVMDAAEQYVGFAPNILPVANVQRFTRGHVQRKKDVDRWDRELRELKEQEK